MPRMTFIERDGTPREVDAPLGLSVLEIAHKHGVDIEGACEGSLACSTCHVVVDGALVDAAERAAIEAALARVDAAIGGTDRDAIAAAADALEEGTRAFAERRMDRGIRAALAGKRVDQLGI